MKVNAKDAFTKQVRVIMPCDLNSYNILFGGNAMKWMDEVAFITATRFLNSRALTVRVTDIKFMHTLSEGDIIEIIGFVGKKYSVKLDINVEVYKKNNCTEVAQKVIEANFVFVSVDESGKILRIP